MLTCGGQMKKCLICIVGLSRTYKTTYPYFYHYIINSNKYKYKFDIITHTSEKNNEIDDIYSQMCSNYYSLTNDIRINDTGASNLMFVRVLECYKHIHEVLKKPIYDVYMFVRFDLQIHFPIKLSNVNDNIVCLLDHRSDGPNRRMHDVHDRDWDFSFIGKYEAFDCMIKALDQYFVKESESTYRVCEEIKSSKVNPKWTEVTSPAFISEYYNGQEGSRIITNCSYKKDTTGCQEYIFVKLNEKGRFVDFKWGIHNCFIGHLVR